MSHYTRRIRCVETGVVYDSIKEAAYIHFGYDRNIWQALNGRRRIAYGFHWEYV